MKIFTIGRVNVDKVGDILKLDNPSQDEVWMFVDYSAFNVPVGARFSFIKRYKNITPVNATLLQVKDQFAVNLPAIPEGWQTICLLHFEGGIPGDITIQKLHRTWAFNDPGAWLFASDVVQEEPVAEQPVIDGVDWDDMQKAYDEMMKNIEQPKLPPNE